MKCITAVIFVALAVVVSSTSALDRKGLKPIEQTTDKYFHGLVKMFRPGRITGGDEITPHSIPYQVGLLIHVDGGSAFCGGSLISETTVLTAAHCAELTTNISIVLGAHNILETEDTQVVVEAASVLVHPDWNSLLLENDIALLTIAEPVELNENIGLVSLPSKSDASQTFDGEIAKASGWGRDSDEAESISSVLRSVDVPVLSNDVCNIYYFGILLDSHICADTNGGKSTCNGDSGGPLVLESDNTQIGLTSFGISLGCEIGWPAAFTRVTSFLDWIEENSDVVISE